MLNIFSLNNVRDQKQLNKYHIYKKVLKKCHHRIEICANKGDGCCFYVVPEFIYGIPKYDTLSCASYIMKRLHSNGFYVTYTYPNLIYINWEHIPSELKNKASIYINKNKVGSSKLLKNEYRYIEDYKSSTNFLNKINKKYLN